MIYTYKIYFQQPTHEKRICNLTGVAVADL